MKQRIVLLGSAFLMLALHVPLLAESITTGTLVSEMTDLRRLADFPSPAYKTIQFSSYDRTSSVPGGPGWFANSDGFGNEPTPNFEAVLKAPGKDGVGEYLVCDVEGPGAIVREWTARIEGVIRMYLDGSETPVFNGPAEEFFLYPYRAYCAASGLDEAVLANTFYQRNAAYCPFPFAKRCRVVWIGNLKRTHFYQLQVRVYEPSAQVATFSPEDLKTYAAILQRASAILADPDHVWEYASISAPASFDATFEPEEWKTAFERTGSGAIERLSILVSAPDRDLALRQTVLHIQCDDFPWGQVQSPVGDFFGAAPGVNPYTSAPFSVAPDGAMTCRFVMPYANNIKIAFENLGQQTVHVSGEVLPMEYVWNDASSMHFRARWRIDHGLTGSGRTPQDLPFLIANGAGVYVGSVSYVLNPNEVPSSGGNWWGEGDEKIFVDDDLRPSTFGTGSEDYYNYAWSSSDIFFYPYCGQPRNDGPANRGFVANNRWHILDPLPFKQRLSFYMELYPHEINPDMAYGRIGYHYARPGLKDDHVAITKEDVRKQELPLGWKPAARHGAARSEFYEAENCIPGETNAVLVPGNLWSGGKLLRWQPKAIGEELTFTVPIAKETEYNVRIAFALDADSGIVSMKVDGQDVNLGGDQGRADLYNPHRVLLRCIGPPPIELKPGERRITLRYEGGPEGRTNGAIGIDFLWLQKR